MAYAHIENLYKDQRVLLFKEVYALEKIHGTSAHLSFKGDKITYFSGGETYEKFVSLFDEKDLLEKFKETYDGLPITVYGEAYGGKQQGMSNTYGKESKFIVFDVKVGECWLNVETAEKVANRLGLEFVYYVKIPADVDHLNKEMERDSVQAIRNGMGEGHPSEGIVIRPLMEFVGNNGKRVIAKHKKEKFRETSTPRPIVDPAKMDVLRKAQDISREWVTLIRLQHVADKIGKEIDVCNIRDFIPGMLEDIKRESEGEVVWSKEVEKEIGKVTAQMIKTIVKNSLVR
jgi:hypothetical protein